MANGKNIAFNINLALRRNHHKIPLNPPLPVCDRRKITKGGNRSTLPLAKGGWEGFYKEISNS
jgi:hypothetical protein